MGDRTTLPCAVQVMSLLIRRKRRSRLSRWERRQYWMHPITVQRPILGYFATSMNVLKADDNNFFDFFRMTQ